MDTRLLVSCFILAAVLDATVPTKAVAVTAQERIDAGDVALSKYDLDAAVLAYREAVQLVPDNYEAVWKLARALVDKEILTSDHAAQKSRYVEAAQLTRTAVSLNPRDSKGHLYLAIAVGKLVLYEGGKRKVELSKEVKAEAEQAIRLNSKEDFAYHVLAIWHREMVELPWILRKFAELLYGKFPAASLDSALANLRHAVELAPNVVPHHVELGITLARAERWADAKKELEKALAAENLGNQRVLLGAGERGIGGGKDAHRRT